MATDELLTEKEVAGLLQMHRITLATWRSEGRGPRWIRVGSRNVRYRRSDLETWLQEGETHTNRAS